MKELLSKYSSLLKNLHQIARKSDCYLIARIQEQKTKFVNLIDSKIETARKDYIKGIGMRVFTKTGHNAFGSTDNIRNKNEVIKLLKQIISSAKKAQELKFATNKEIFKLRPTKDIVIPETKYSFEGVKLGRIKKTLININKKTRKMLPVKANSLFNITEETWRITRSDGTDVSFKIPRSIFYCFLTYKKNSQTIQRSARIAGKSYEILLDKQSQQKLIKEIKKITTIMPKLIKAPVYKSGYYDLLLDAELAGTLIHEAFGHAAESDYVYTGSILSKNKKLLKGKKVANSVVSIYDYAKEDERGFYPYDSQGVKRKKITIVEKGILKEAISDVYTAQKIEAPLTGGSKAEFYSSIPIPRMSNTILEVEKVIDDKLFSKDLVNISAQDLQEFLIKFGILKKGRKIIFLQGTRGGQVNILKGAFMLGTNTVYEITKDSIKLYKPTSFSGSILKTLYSIKFALGKKIYGFPGTCGKAGQLAPVSDTANKFIFITTNRGTKIGGN